MFLAAQYASSNLDETNVTILTVDTDVAILACYFAPRITANLYIQIGVGNNRRLVEVSPSKINEGLQNALPGLHAVSGCHSCSSFHGIGKRKWFKFVEKDPRHQDILALLGNDIDVNPLLIDGIEELVCSLYGEKTTDIHTARYKKICSKNTPDPASLPPTKDELVQHAKRANYQAFIWKRALEMNPELPGPDGYGWKIENGQLKYVWMENEIAPESILEMVECNCSRKKCSTACQCVSYGLKCTDLEGACDNGGDDLEDIEEDDEEEYNEYDETDDEGDHDGKENEENYDY